MKKITLLFLALSALAFGAASTTGGANANNSVTTENGTTTYSSKIDVNVSAVVYETAPDFIITDANGQSISSIDFRHQLSAGTLTGQAEQSLTASIRASGAGLSEGDSNSSTLSTEFGTNTLTLANGGNKLTSTLAATRNGYDTNGAIFNVSSSLSGEDAQVGTYDTQTTTLTITYNKN